MTASRPPWSKQSLAAQALGHVEPVTKAIVPPIHVATTYIRDEDNAYSSGYVYGRPDNATVRDAEAVIAMLEEAEAGALLFSSGMAAATAVFQALDPGDHIVAPRVMYWALRNWLLTEAKRWGLETTFVETDDPDQLRAAVVPGRTKLVWIETPSNPLVDHHRHRRRGRHRAPGGSAARGRFHRCIPDPHPAAGAWRRHRDACGHQGAERPFGCGRGRARRREAG
jgi:cystathionine gamma-synthase